MRSEAKTVQCELEMLSAYADGELDADEAAAIERHLFGCAHCRSQYRRLRELHLDLGVSVGVQALPRRLELELLRQAERFVAAPAAASPRAPSRHSAQHVALAAAVVLLAFAGMAYFSARGGQLPTLSTVEHHIEGLPELGYAALRSHLAQLNEPEATRAAVSTARRTLSVSSGVQFTAPQVKALRWLDAQPIELDGLEGASFTYRFHDVPLSLIALPREAALDRLGLAQPPVKACLMREFERCFVDDVGTSLCLLTRDNALEIWVAHLPLPTLAKLAGAQLD